MASVLVLTRSVPYPPNAGDKVVTYGFLRSLAQRGHDVHLLSYGDESDDSALAVLADEGCNSVARVEPSDGLLPFELRRATRLLVGRSHVMGMFHSRRFAAAVAKRTRELAPDVVLAEHPYMGQFFCVPAVRRALRKTDSRPVTNAHVVEYAAHERRRSYAADLLTRVALALEVPRLRQRELAVYERSDRTLVLGEGDRQELRDKVSTPICHQRVALTPEDYDPSPEGNERQTVVFFGSYDWFPNRDGVQLLCDHVFPAVREQRPNAELLLAGRDATDEVRALDGRPGVTVLGEVEDLGSLVRSASVVVAPLRVGGGVRIKILESMAWGTPVVATSAAVEGVEATPGVDLLVADEWNAFADAVASLLDAPERRREIGERARRTVEETYATEVVGAQLAESLGL